VGGDFGEDEWRRVRLARTDAQGRRGRRRAGRSGGDMDDEIPF
jgi:hypothetical protein